MSAGAIRQVIVEALSRIAPEVDMGSIRPDAPLRDQLDLDSIDFLNLMLALHERLGLEIPESDYARFSTMDDAVAYLKARARPERGNFPPNAKFLRRGIANAPPLASPLQDAGSLPAGSHSASPIR